MSFIYSATGEFIKRDNVETFDNTVEHFLGISNPLNIVTDLTNKAQEAVTDLTNKAQEAVITSTGTGMASSGTGMASATPVSFTDSTEKTDESTIPPPFNPKLSAKELEEQEKGLTRSLKEFEEKISQLNRRYNFQTNYVDKKATFAEIEKKLE